MSCRGWIVLCALLLGGSACWGDRFDAVSGPASDGGPPDTTQIDVGEDASDVGSQDAIPADAGDDAGDGGSSDATVPDSHADARDASLDRTMADGAAADASATDSPATDSLATDSRETGAIIDGTSTDRAAGDAAPDVAPSDAVASDVAGMAWCAGKQIAFCADFDTVTAWSDTWTSASVTPGSLLEFNLVDFTSPRRSLHTKIPAGGGMESATARLTKVVSTSLSRSVLEFDCNVASIGAGSGEWLLQTARIGRNGRESGVALLAQDMDRWGVFVATDVPVLYGELPAPPPYGRFVHVTLDVVWSATAGSVNVLFDGVTVFSKDALATALATTTSSVEVDVGLIEAAGTTPPAEMSIDNVAFQLR